MGGQILDRSLMPANLKRDYEGDVNTTLFTQSPLFSDVSGGGAKKFTLDGEDLYLLLETGRNWGISSFQVADALPDSQAPGTVNATLRAARVAAGLSIDNELAMLSRRKQAAYAPALAMKMKNTKNALLMTLERMAFGKGDAVMATVGATGSANATTITVDDNRYFSPGQKLDLWTGNTLTSSTTPYVVATVSRTVKTTITVNANSLTATNGDLLVLSGSCYKPSATRLSSDPNGLQNIADDGTIASTFMGASSTTYPTWKATIVDAASAVMVPKFMSQVGIQYRTVTNGKVPNRAWTNPIQIHYMIYGLPGSNADRRFTQADLNKFGAKGDATFDFGSGAAVPFKTTSYCPEDKAFFYPSEDLIYGELSPVKLEDFDGVTMIPYKTSTGGTVAATQGWLTIRYNMGCLTRPSFAMIKNLSNPDSIVTTPGA